MSTVQFTREATPTPTSDQEREKILANPGFGTYFTDHTAVVDWSEDEGWHNARIEPYGPISLDPASAVFHYGQEIFEGLKAYRHSDGTVRSFRPQKNAQRLNTSAQRLALPELPEDVFMEAVRLLVQTDSDWIPDGDGEALYLRPFMIATEKFLGVRPAKEVSFRVIASPAGNYFGGELHAVPIWLSQKYQRAGAGGTGEAKCGGNYAASLAPQLEAEAHGCPQVLFTDPTNNNAVDELGGMNVFFVLDNDTMVTPRLNGNILHGVTRSSVIELAKEMGLDVQERDFTLDEWRERTSDGSLREAFACGTAAVITPIAELRMPEETLALPESAQDSSVWGRIRQQLLSIQTGNAEDTHGWMVDLA